ncbi:transcriptional regulator [Mycolicibacterium sp. P9-64]|uniref:helix-turn-helix domain-containing protein n=1 Tax=Mycolicibacterium sp. P9-64 TaxID=2024612 RepID=UPI0011EFE758|nr:helix-turn-helix domain-containing protein [Mycolicibacterium sp. P9-64]KAA0075625.1 transcriptional regulator [Mycolicibacterium sp. P9-64]
MGISRTSGGRASAPSSACDVRAVHDLFVAGRVDASFLDNAPLRRVVAESWQRSLATGVDPDLGGVTSGRATLTLEQLRATHPLASALPVIRRLLVEDASDAGVVVAVTAADGTLLWVEGDPSACRRAQAMNFVPGADWSEHSAGTNAPGTALALDRELQIRGSEHFTRIVQPWSCTAVPVHDPVTGLLLGAIDLTGGADVATPQTLALVRATAVAVENHLALLRLTNPGQPAVANARLSVLGAERPRWTATDDGGNTRTCTLTGRHADILVLLSRRPEGLSADHLAMLLDDQDLDAVTIRAEMSRLRRVIGADNIGSRPYRLLAPVRSDVDDVFTALQRGDVESAMARYAGALLPQSVSPAIARLRTELGTGLRAAVLSTGSPALLRRWLELPEGRDDRDGWQSLHDHASVDAFARARARGHLAGLDSEFS